MRKYTNNILIGVNQDAEPLTWVWEHSNGLAVIGKGGSGKTTGAAYWLSQLACQGVRFLMADPHMTNKQSLFAQTEHLQKALLMPCVSEYKDITRYITYFHELGHKRIHNEAEHFPLMFVIDEFTSYILNSDDTKQAALKLLDSVNQYRKVNLRLFLIGQTWGQAVKVISGLRDAISDAIVLKSSVNDARKFCAFEATAKEAKLLEPGKGYFNDEMVWIPRLTGTSKLVTQKRVETFNHPPAETTKQPWYETLPKNEQLLEVYYDLGTRRTRGIRE